MNSPRALFISYAREDGPAAHRIAEALRSQGVEVWFDQDELRGGDAWDAKIRKQIDTCALFMPIISKNTETRSKGYFRLEWKLAVEQTHLLMEGVPYLLPVVVDDTAEAAVGVPPEFRRVQWTRLPGALPSPAFVEQVKRMLDGPATAAAQGPAAPVPVRATGPTKAPSRIGAVGLVVTLVAALAVVAVLLLKPSAPLPQAATPPAPAVAVTPAPAPVDDKSIAVLPFENMSEEKDSLFFTDGIHEDILTNLALVRDLHVVSRTSVMQYRATTKTIRQIGEELHVAYILEGSVRRAGTKVRVTGQLINARTDEHVWAKAYDRDISDIFGIQAELSKEIAGALAAALSPNENRLLERHRTENVAAYELFLKGRDIRNQAPSGSPASLRETEEFVQKAVDLDPNFATAWGYLAEVHALFVFWEIDHTPERLAKADAAMANAERLDPDSPEVIRSLGTYAYYGYRDYGRATEQYEKLAEIQPNDPTVQESLGLILRRQGKWAESLVKMRKAMELDPGNIAYMRSFLESLRACHRWDEAIALQRRLVDLLPKERLREQIALARLLCSGDNSTKPAEEFLATLSPEDQEAPRVLQFRKIVARWKGEFAEFKRLDAQAPHFDGDGVDHVYQDVNLAQVYAEFGDMKGGIARLGNSTSELRERLAAQPLNTRVYSTLAMSEALLGHKEEAVRLARKATEILPLSRDAIDGGTVMGGLVAVYAWTGDKDKALELLEQMMRIPLNTDIFDLRRDPMLEPLLGDPRFEKLLSDPRNNKPII